MTKQKSIMTLQNVFIATFIFLAASVLFWFLYGFEILNPHYASWMLSGDASVNLLGFNFFSQESWHWPIGKIENYSYPQGTSLVYADAIPLLSIFGKIVNTLMGWNASDSGGLTQYCGLWVFLCFLLQGYVGYRLSTIATRTRFGGVVGSLLFLTFPALLHRSYGSTRHYSLMAHFLILTALLFLVQKNKLSAKALTWRWGILLAVAAGVHFYLFFMVLLLWLAVTVLQWQEMGARARKINFLHVGIVGLVLLFLFYQLGYFAIDPGIVYHEGGFGRYSMGIPSWIDSQGLSKILPDLGDQPEGYIYLGLGILALFISVLVNKKNRAKIKTDFNVLTESPLGFSLAMALVLSLTFRFCFIFFSVPDGIGAGVVCGFYFWMLQKNPHLVKALGYRANSKKTLGQIVKLLFLALVLLGVTSALGHILRASGRVSWVLGYALLFYLLTFPTKKLVLVGVLVLQLVDVVPLVRAVSGENLKLSKIGNEVEFLGESWAKRIETDDIKQIIFIAPEKVDRIPITMGAILQNIPAGPVHVARSDRGDETGLEEKAKKEIRSGRLEAGALYIIGDESLWPNTRNLLGEHVLSTHF